MFANPFVVMNNDPNEYCPVHGKPKLFCGCKSASLSLRADIACPGCGWGSGHAPTCPIGGNK